MTPPRGEDDQAQPWPGRNWAAAGQRNPQLGCDLTLVRGSPLHLTVALDIGGFDLFGQAEDHALFLHVPAGHGGQRRR